MWRVATSVHEAPLPGAARTDSVSCCRLERLAQSPQVRAHFRRAARVSHADRLGCRATRVCICEHHSGILSTHGRCGDARALRDSEFSSASSDRFHSVVHSAYSAANSERAGLNPGNMDMDRWTGLPSACRRLMPTMRRPTLAGFGSLGRWECGRRARAPYRHDARRAREPRHRKEQRQVCWPAWSLSLSLPNTGEHLLKPPWRRRSCLLRSWMPRRPCQLFSERCLLMVRQPRRCMLARCFRLRFRRCHHCCRSGAPRMSCKGQRFYRPQAAKLFARPWNREQGLSATLSMALKISNSTSALKS